MNVAIKTALPDDEKEMPRETDECLINEILDTSLTLVKPLGNTMIENDTAEKDIDLCPSCNKRANEKTIQYNTCTKWYHFRCTHLPNYQLYIYNKQAENTHVKSA